MSDPTSKTQDTPPEASRDDAINPSRRKLTGAVLGVSAVFTLASRPVWANQCTISGMISGNVSAPIVTCEGCTPVYWKTNLGSWEDTGFSPVNVDNTLADTFNTVFGVSEYIKTDTTPYTLLEVLNGIDDPKSTDLGLHAVAALLNAAHSDVNYGYTSGEIITLFKTNYATNGAALKDSFVMLNMRVCPLEQ